MFDIGLLYILNLNSEFNLVLSLASKINKWPIHTSLFFFFSFQIYRLVDLYNSLQKRKKKLTYINFHFMGVFFESTLRLLVSCIAFFESFCKIVALSSLPQKVFSVPCSNLVIARLVGNFPRLSGTPGCQLVFLS